MLILTLIGNSTLIYLAPRKDFSSLFFPSLIWIIVCSICIALFVGWEPQLIVLIAFFGALSEINYYILMGKEKIILANWVKLIICSSNIIIISLLSLLNIFNDVIYYVYSMLIAHFFGFVYGLII